MRQILLVLSVLLLGLTWAVAQQDSTTQSSPSSESQSGAGSASQSSPSSGGQSGAGTDSSGTAAGSGQMSRSGAGGQTTVEGCLSGSSGNYTLSDKNGMTYQLTGDTAKLSEHVGHEVKVTGMTGSGSASGESASTGAGSATGSSSGSSQTLQVSSVKHVSKTCKSSGGMSH